MLSVQHRSAPVRKIPLRVRVEKPYSGCKEGLTIVKPVRLNIAGKSNHEVDAMQCNVGTTDRSIRIVLGITIVVLGMIVGSARQPR